MKIFKLKPWIFTFLLFFFCMEVSAQERITGLVVNPKVKAAAHKYQKSRKVRQSMILPFFDDFSNPESIFPDQNRWADNYVYINDSYAYNAPTVGVATFDAIDNLGNLFSHASPYAFKADSLTSVEIRLDSIFTPSARKITRADSLYFSFFYQPQGYGNAPAPGDSLILDFLAPDEDIVFIIPADTVITGSVIVITPADTIINESWVRVWSSKGESLSSFYNSDSTWFRHVMIPVTDSARFYKPDFKFRFTNYASLASSILPDWQSNGDQWNIDYVYFNTGRSIHDTAYPDVAFASRAPNMLRNFTSMPYDQFRQNFVNEMADSVNIKITNLDDNAYNASYRYEVENAQHIVFHTYSGGNFTVPPYATNGYVTHSPVAHPPVNFIYQIGNQEQITFTTTHILSPEVNLSRKQNDTIRYHQIFSNYLAYDDGTAEAGYGVTPAGAQAAYKFQLNKSDSLFGAYIYFNRTLTQGNVHKFTLKIWNDYFGEPGDVIYSKVGYEPAFEDSLNKFFYYKLDSALMIEPGTFSNNIFYIGWEQTTDDHLNLGYDMNTDASTHTFWKTFQGWNSSINKGAIMLRPVIGKEKVLSMGEKPNIKLFSLYPNPASGDKVGIKSAIASSEQNQYLLRISSSDGRVIAKQTLSHELSIAGIPGGFYIVQLLKQGKTVATQKLIIYR